MKDETATPPVAEDGKLPSVAEYVAAGHDPDTAEALAGVDAICEERRQALEALGPEGRKRLAEAHERHNRMVDADPKCQAEREVAKVAMEALSGALDQGEPAEVARRRAEEACGRPELRFDYTHRAEELRREAFAEVAVTEVAVTASPISSNGRAQPRPRRAGRPSVRGSSRRSSTRSGDSGSDDGEPSDEPPGPAEARVSCACGCGRPRRQDLDPPHRYYATDACRKRHARARHVRVALVTASSPTG